MDIIVEDQKKPIHPVRYAWRFVWAVYWILFVVLAAAGLPNLIGNYGFGLGGFLGVAYAATLATMRLLDIP